MKNIVNKYLRKFGAEIHGVGYIQKLKNSDINKSEWKKQKELTANASIIFDVGANRGTITSQYLNLFPKATIHAFEPFTQSCENFLELHGHNKRVILNEVALSSKNGEAEMSINKSVDTNSLLESTKLGASSDKQCEKVGSVKVPTMTLDKYCIENDIEKIDILKMDTQGFELEVLKGAETLLREKRIKLIYTESYFVEQYINQPLFHDLSKHLYNYGFTLQDIYDPYYSSKHFLWCDSIFILKE